MTNIGAVSYAIGGCAFLVLTILLATSWRGRFQGAMFVSAGCASVIWCFSLAYQARVSSPYSTMTFALEVARSGLWLSLLLALLRGYNWRQVLPRSLLYGIHGLWVLALLYGISIALGVHAGFSVSVLALLAMALAGLALLELIYRNTRPENRWTIKFLILGVGGIFVYDLFLYSQALLFREIDADFWGARGAVNALAVPLIAVAGARNPQWSVDVFVSRHAVFYTTALLGGGIYLLAMAAGGYYIRLYGGTWGAFAQVVFLVAAALTLAVVLLSTEVRGRVKVFLVKHFYKSKYDYRLEWLRLTRALATPDEAMPLRERAVRALAQLVESPGGGLWLQDEDGGDFRLVAQWNTGMPDNTVEAANSPFVSFLRQRECVIDLMQWRSDPARYGNLALPYWLDSKCAGWLIIPLTQEGRVFGFVLLTAAQIRRNLAWEDIELLKTAGCQVASYLVQQQSAQALAQARQFDAYHRLTAFIMHDLKNLIAQQSLVVTNAARHKNNPAFIEDVIRTVDNSVIRMNQLLDQLKRGESPKQRKRTALQDLLVELIAKHESVQPAPRLHAEREKLEVLADPQRLATVLGHVIRNAQEATARDGRVDVRLARDGQNAIIEIEDSGMGMEPAFVAERLFRPFDSTKGSKGMGIGAYQVREFVREAGGDVQVLSAPGKGTTFRIALPALSPEPESQLGPETELHK